MQINVIVTNEMVKATTPDRNEFRPVQYLDCTLSMVRFMASEKDDRGRFAQDVEKIFSILDKNPLEAFRFSKKLKEPVMFTFDTDKLYPQFVSGRKITKRLYNECEWIALMFLLQETMSFIKSDQIPGENAETFWAKLRAALQS